MRAARVFPVVCLLALATPLWAEGPVIDHSAVACMVAEKFPQLEARIVEPEMISRARVQFRGERGPWYFVTFQFGAGQVDATGAFMIALAGDPPGSGLTCPAGQLTGRCTSATSCTGNGSQGGDLYNFVMTRPSP